MAKWLFLRREGQKRESVSAHTQNFTNFANVEIETANVFRYLFRLAMPSKSNHQHNNEKETIATESDLSFLQTVE